MEEEPQVPDDVLDQRKAFDEERRKGIFSTDVAAILGLSRYGTALTVYKGKRGELVDREMSLPAWIGSRLETLVAELYTSATGNRVRFDDLAHYHPIYDWLGAHLDARVVGDPDHIVELKTRNNARGWGDDGSADIPPDVWCQVQEQMYVVGGKLTHVATLFSNSSFRVYEVPPDPAFEAEILPVLANFWNDNYLAGVPPLPSGHEVDTAIVQSLPGGKTGFIKPATPEQGLIVQQARLARLNYAQAEYAKKQAENRVKGLIGEDADGITGAFGTVYWKRTKDWTEFEWELIAKAYRSAAEELLEMASPGDDEALVEKYAGIETALPLIPDLYSKTRKGTRSIRFDLVEE